MEERNFPSVPANKKEFTLGLHSSPRFVSRKNVAANRDKNGSRTTVLCCILDQGLTTRSIDQDGLKLTEIRMPLSPRC